MWSPLVPIGILFLYGLLRANYERFQELEADRDKIAAERDAAISQGRNEEMRTAVESRLGSLREEGEGLRSSGYEDIEAWTSKTKNFIEAAFGTGRAQLFLSNAGYTASEDVQGFVLRPEEVWLEFRLRRLDELIAQSDALAISPNFNPQSSL